MFFGNIDHFIRRIAGIDTLYRKHYGSLRHSFHRAGRTLGLVKGPIYVHWLATYECNFSCLHCEADAGNKKVDLLSTDQVLRTVKELGELGVQTLIVSGGEPLLRKDLFEVLKAAGVAGIQRVSLATNGYLVERYQKELASADLSAVHVSIDGLPETNDRIRGKQGAAQKAWDSLEFFKEIGVKERILNTLVHSQNIQELERFSEAVFASPATVWNIQLPLEVGRAKVHEFLFLEETDLLDLFHFLQRARENFPIQVAETASYLGPFDGLLRPRPFFCGAGLETCSIMPDGEILGCHVTYDRSYSEGNVKTVSIKEIWKKRRGRFKCPPVEQECKTCPHFAACRGGCLARRKGGRPCFRDVWESQRPSIASGSGGEMLTF